MYSYISITVLVLVLYVLRAYALLVLVEYYKVLIRMYVSPVSDTVILKVCSSGSRIELSYFLFYAIIELTETKLNNTTSMYVHCTVEYSYVCTVLHMYEYSYICTIIDLRTYTRMYTR